MTPRSFLFSVWENGSDIQLMTFLFPFPVVSLSDLSFGHPAVGMRNKDYLSSLPSRHGSFCLNSLGFILSCLLYKRIDPQPPGGAFVTNLAGYILFQWPESWLPLPPGPVLYEHSPPAFCNHGAGKHVRQREDKREQMKEGKTNFLLSFSTDTWVPSLPFCLSSLFP